MNRLHPASALLALLAFVACAAPQGPPAADERPDPPPAAPLPTDAASQEHGDAPLPGGPLTAANAGGFYARIEPSPAEMPLNEDFDLSVWLYEDAEGTRPLEGVELFVDARMPAHGHGMNQEVQPVQGPDGRWRVDGMLLHMFGHWELYVDVTRGARTERAQLDIELE